MMHGTTNVKFIECVFFVSHKCGRHLLQVDSLELVPRDRELFSLKLGHALQVGSIRDVVTGIFHWLDPAVHTVALGSAQPLTEMSNLDISWG
jgi:hypothetical protein